MLRFVITIPRFLLMIPLGGCSEAGLRRDSSAAGRRIAPYTAHQTVLRVGRRLFIDLANCWGRINPSSKPSCSLSLRDFPSKEFLQSQNHFERMLTISFSGLHSPISALLSRGLFFPLLHRPPYKAPMPFSIRAFRCFP